MGVNSYPAAIRGELDAQLSRGLWLIKWFLVIPHLVALAFLWIALGLTTFVAGLSILFTGVYPRELFDFNVGVLRWSWRVQFYAFTFATDKYPPFSLQPDPSYPADLSVEYPEKLSRKLVLVKWWLLAIPQYLVVAAFSVATGRPGAFGLLPLAAGLMLLFTNVYPPALFNFIMGLERWTWRVFVYALLMRDEYPPFVLDEGAREPLRPATNFGTSSPAPA